MSSKSSEIAHTNEAPFLPERDYIRYVREYAVANQFVCRLSVTFVHLLSPSNFSTMFLCHFVFQLSADLHANFYGDRPRVTPRRGLNVSRIARYRDVGHIDGYISEIVQDTASGTINNQQNPIVPLWTLSRVTPNKGSEPPIWGNRLYLLSEWRQDCLLYTSPSPRD